MSPTKSTKEQQVIFSVFCCYLYE